MTTDETFALPIVPDAALATQVLPVGCVLIVTAYDALPSRPVVKLNPPSALTVRSFAPFSWRTSPVAVPRPVTWPPTVYVVGGALPSGPPLEELVLVPPEDELDDEEEDDDDDDDELPSFPASAPPELLEPPLEESSPQPTPTRDKAVNVTRPIPIQRCA
jgi:hypothetical protein